MSVGKAPLTELVQVQARIQKFLKPGIWVPILRRPHYWSEEWCFDVSNSETCIRDIANAVVKMDESSVDNVFQVDKVTNKSIRICCFTKKRWLDLVDIKVNETKEGKSEAKVVSYSTGVLPLSTPGAAIANPLLCWFPFYDQQMAEKVWLPLIRENLSISCTVLKKGRKW